MNIPQMSRDEALEQLTQNFGMQANHVYLLDLIPLIEMMWVDGKCQDAEVQLLYDFAIRHIADLSTYAEGEELISDDEINAFLDRFIRERPDPALLKALRELVNICSLQHSDQEVNRHRKKRIIDYCLDIAAASVVQYPYENRDRVMRDEKTLLFELMEALHIDPSQSIEETS